MRPALVLALALLPCLHAQAASTDTCVPAPDVDIVDIHALQEKAAAGDVCASLTVARFSDSQQQYMNSRYYYLLAAKQGDLSSDQRLLELYRTTSENIVQQAIYEEWLVAAAERGMVEAQLELGKYLLAWKEDGQDRIGAMFWFETAAKQGNLQAQYLLSEQYRSDMAEEPMGIASGDDVAMHFAHDDTKAASWLCKAAQGGLPRAQAALAEVYSFGSGVIPQDQDQRRLWLEKAAANGEADAIAQLDDSAEHWYTRAENWGKRQLITDEARCPDVALAVEP
jgi:TPR repeat protein